MVRKFDKRKCLYAANRTTTEQLSLHGDLATDDEFRRTDLDAIP